MSTTFGFDLDGEFSYLCGTRAASLEIILALTRQIRQERSTNVLSRFTAIRLAGIAVLLLALTAGCRTTTDPSVALLEHEARGLEDKVYHLHDIVQRKEAEIASLRRENETLRKQLGLPQGQIEADDGLIPRSARQSTPVDLAELEELAGPVVDLGSTSTTIELESVAPGTPLSDGPLLEEFQTEEEIITDRVVTKISLNPRLTGGYQDDDSPGDDGVMVVIEPQNEAGQYVPAAGPVSVVLLDPTYAGKEAFVDRWDYDVADATTHLKRTLLGKGIHLRIPWTDGPPEHETLQLHVRYTTEDGEVLQEKKDIKIDLRGGTSQSWTPAPVPLPQPRTASLPSASSPAEPPPASERKSGEASKAPLWKPFR